MKDQIQNVIEATVVLILVYLLVTNATRVSYIIGSSSRAYTSAVRALQGR